MSRCQRTVVASVSKGDGHGDVVRHVDWAELAVSEHRIPDEVALAHALGCEATDLLRAIGGPWQTARLADEHRLTRIAFIGRAGPSVMIVVDLSSGAVEVGAVVGEWIDPGTLRHRMDVPIASLRWLAADPATMGGWLDALGRAVDAAFEAKAPSLRICRYCGGVFAPEHLLRDDECHGCGSLVHGVVY